MSIGRHASVANHIRLVLHCNAQSASTLAFCAFGWNFCVKAAFKTRFCSAPMLVRISRRIAFCLERARACGEKARAAADSSADRGDFSDLELRWLALARSYEYSKKLANQINDRDAYKKYATSMLRCAGADLRDYILTKCMTLAFVETMKAVNVTGTSEPDSATVARLIVEVARRGERDLDRLCNAVLILMNANGQPVNKIAYPPWEREPVEG